MHYGLIKEMPDTEKPREKMLKSGVAQLSNQELLAILIRTGRENHSALDIAKDVLYYDKRGLAALSNITAEELVTIKGIGPSKACLLLAGIELGKRVLASEHYKDKITCPGDVYDHLKVSVMHLKKEKFFALLLDTKNQIIAVEDISTGSLNASIVHPREVFHYAIKKNAKSVILAHNHPSGYPAPSKEDKQITERLVEAGKIVGIEVMDHIVLGNESYYSFKEHFDL
ncbi:MAG: DNA repair protein RadC [Clostridia bacterium]|nr:DNA repair protein RadC [Clostridia bacterium]